MKVDDDFNADKTEMFLQMTKMKSSNKRPKTTPSRKIFIHLKGIS